MQYLLSFFVALFAMFPSSVFAWDSLVTSGDFTGIAADVSTAVAGIISIALIILGASLLLRALSR